MTPAIIIKGGGQGQTKIPAPSAPGMKDQALESLADSLTLPTEKTIPKDNIDDFTLFIYGLKKIGKTSLTSMFPNACHIFYEPSGEDYSLYAIEPETWLHFKAYVIKFEREKVAGTLTYKNFTIDIVDMCFNQCLKYICGLQGLDYPPNDFGKTWDKIAEEFRTWIHRLARVGGLIVVSHGKEAEVERADGRKYSSIIPTCKAKCTEILSAFCTLNGYYFIDESGNRQLGIAPNNTYEAGNRFRNHFKYAGTNEKISIIPMGNSEYNSYSNFKAAFDNLLLKPREEAKQLPVETTGKITLKLK